MEIFEGKIRDEIGKLWKREEKEYEFEKEIGMIAAEE